MLKMKQETLIVVLLQLYIAIKIAHKSVEVAVMKETATRYVAKNVVLVGQMYLDATNQAPQHVKQIAVHIHGIQQPDGMALDATNHYQAEKHAALYVMMFVTHIGYATITIQYVVALIVHQVIALYQEIVHTVINKIVVKEVKEFTSFF